LDFTLQSGENPTEHQRGDRRFVHLKEFGHSKKEIRQLLKTAIPWPGGSELPVNLVSLPTVASKFLNQLANSEFSDAMFAPPGSNFTAELPSGKSIQLQKSRYSMI
jgi:hypothetical protein